MEGPLNLARIEIRTERLLLREFQATDIPAVLEYASDPEVVRFLKWGPSTPEQVAEFVLGTAEWRLSAPRRVFELGIVLQASGTVVGGCGLRIVYPEHRDAELGYVLHRAHWGGGIATEAARAILGFGFDVLGLHRIHALADPANVPSVRVLEKIGMRREGLLRENKLFKGTWRHHFLYAILEGETLRDASAILPFGKETGRIP